MFLYLLLIHIKIKVKTYKKLISKRQVVLFQIYKEVFDFFNSNLKLIALVIIFTKLPLILINHFIPQTSSEVVFLIVIMGIITTALSNGALACLFSDILNQNKPNPLNNVKMSLNYLPRIIIATIIYGFLITIGLLCFVLPGVIMGARLSLYNYYIVYENKTPLQALKESALSTGGSTPQIILLFMGIFSITILPYYLFSMTYASAEIFSSVVLKIAIDFFFSILSTLIVVLSFRIYCLVKQNKGVIF